MITDFGFAAYYDESVDEPLASMVGSSFYIAPEVLRQSYGHQCDMWSVGVTRAVLMRGGGLVGCWYRLRGVGIRSSENILFASFSVESA